MGNYIKLQLENILTEGQTIAPEYCDKKYVIYYNPKETRQKVRINTDYYQNDNVMMLCKSYDRGLCDAIEEYEKLNLKYIEVRHMVRGWMAPDKIQKGKQNVNIYDSKQIQRTSEKI